MELTTPQGVSCRPGMVNRESGVPSWAGEHLGGPQRPGEFCYAGLGRVGEVLRCTDL